MIYVNNKLIPFEGYKAITIFPFVFYKGSYPTKEARNHEAIHGRQQIELLLVFFYVIYIIEAIFKGYKNISFEKEAYANEKNFNYLNERKLFNQWRK
jgi:hypothetical protein